MHKKDAYASYIQQPGPALGRWRWGDAAQRILVSRLYVGDGTRVHFSHEDGLLTRGC